MPTYDYVCQACDHAFELVQSMRDPVKRACPKCKKRKLKRLIGIGAAIFIGGKSAPPPAASPTESKATTTPESDTSTKTDVTETPKEKTISGGTSTPTHEAREGRGIGNLKDAAKRTRQENAAKSPSSSASEPKINKTTTKKKEKKTPAKKSAPKAKTPRGKKKQA